MIERIASRSRAAGAFAGFAATICAALAVSWYLKFVFAGPTPEQYTRRFEPAARAVPAGSLSFGKLSQSCSHYPTVFVPGFPDYGAAYFGFIILNPERFAALPAAVQRFAYAHECGHQYVGYSETAADCYAVRRGKADGWLTAASLQEICDFLSTSKGTALHLPGPKRCLSIRSCYAPEE